MLVLAGLVVAPPAASASCTNHLVTSRTDQLVLFENLDDLIAARSSPSLQRDRAPSPLNQPDAPRKGPCSGISCSNSVPMPVSSTTLLPDGRDRWGALGIVYDVDDTSVYNRTTEGPTPAPSGDWSSIFHPPRV